MKASSNLKQLFEQEGGVARSSSLSEAAAQAVREMILLEKLPPGTQLPERDIAEALNISRTPMREAIRLLANEGLVSYTPSRRPYVADPSLDEINECLRVQGSLEALAGEWACTLAADKDIDDIAAINEQFRRAKEEEEGPLEAFRLDMQFHEAIVAASKNKTLAEKHSTLNARLWRIRFLSSQRKESRAGTLQEHQNIVDALKVRDPLAASQALKEHLSTAEVNVAAAVEERKQAKEGIES